MKRAWILLAVACGHHDEPPKLDPSQRAVVRPVPPGPYTVTYNCEHSNEPFGKGGDINHQMIDLGAKTRVTTAYAYTDAPIAPPPPAVANLSPALVAMASDAVDRVLAGGPYTAELPPSEGTVCILTIAKGAQNLLVIDKADTKQKDAVSDLVRVFRP
ncbi:MAG: hypothetical protein JO257_04415 [Deltaproteobacteria bacterium]|nr:hypothetical protein [Deltaproteobacteria bacterium]